MRNFEVDITKTLSDRRLNKDKHKTSTMINNHRMINLSFCDEIIDFKITPDLFECYIDQIYSNDYHFGISFNYFL